MKPHPPCNRPMVFTTGWLISCIAALLTTGLIAPRSAMAGHTPCLTRWSDTLRQGGFIGPIVCANTGSTFRLVGRVRRGGYIVYDYRYRYHPRKGAVLHGGQKIILLRGDRYVGQYALSPPPFARITLAGHKVRLRMANGSGASDIDLSGAPPRHLLFAGDELVFTR